MNFPEKVATKAATVRPVRVLLSVLASPLYLLGFIVGFIWVALVWLYAAAAVGFSEATDRSKTEPTK